VITTEQPADLVAYELNDGKIYPNPGRGGTCIEVRQFGTKTALYVDTCTTAGADRQNFMITVTVSSSCW
jgi:hypothetical protein